MSFPISTRLIKDAKVDVFPQQSCCIGVVSALALFSDGLARAESNIVTALSANIIGDVIITPTLRAALLTRFRELSQIIRDRVIKALRKLSNLCDKSSCCEQAATSIAEVSIADLNLIVTALTDPTLIDPTAAILLTARLDEILRNNQASINFILSVVSKECDFCDEKSDPKGKIFKVSKCENKFTHY